MRLIGELLLGFGRALGAGLRLLGWTPASRQPDHPAPDVAYLVSRREQFERANAEMEDRIVHTLLGGAEVPASPEVVRDLRRRLRGGDDS